MLITSGSWRVNGNLQWGIETNPGLICFWFTSLRDWLTVIEKTRAAFSTNRGFVTNVFPRFRQFRCFYLKFSLALKGIWYRPLWLLWVWFYDTQSKSALVSGFVLHKVDDDFSKLFRGSYKTYMKKPYEEKLQNLSPWKHRKWINMSKCRTFYENNLIAFCKIKLFFNIWWLPTTKTKYTIL